MGWNSGFQLRVIGGNERDRVIPLLAKEVILGRAASARAKGRDNQVNLTDPTVSRTHCSLLWDHRKKCYVLTHLSKTNSTKVDGERVTRADLAIGSKIQMGHVVLQMESISASYGSDAEEEAAPKGPWGPSDLPLDPVVASRQAKPDFDPALAYELEPVPHQRPLPEPTPPPVAEPARPHQLPDYIPPIPKVVNPALPPPRRRSVPLNAPGGTPPADAPPPPPPSKPPAAAKAGGDGPKPSRAGWRMLVLEGPDKGIVVPLNATEMLLGRTMGLADPRYGHAVLIGDSSIPYEQALLRWEDEQGSYVVQVNNHALPMVIHRATGQNINIEPGDSMMLQIGDKLSVGNSVLELEQIKRRG
jgi:hypothetical protein